MSAAGSKIGIFVLCFPVPSETFIVTKVLGLLDAGVDLQVFALRPSPHWESFEVLKDRADLRRRVHTGPPLSRSPRLLLQAILALLRTALYRPRAFARFVNYNWRTRASRRQFDLGFWKSILYRLPFVGHSLDILHVEFDAQGLGVADLKDYLGCRLLLSSRGAFGRLDVLDRFPGAPEYLYRHADAYHFISGYLQNEALALGLPKSVPSWLIAPAIDTGLFTPPARGFGENGQKLRLLSVGRLAWAKGYEFAVDAVARLDAAGISVEYTIIGDGPYQEPIEFAARQYGLLQRGVIRLVGSVPREQILRHYAGADVMLHAAVEEGFCNAVIEAQAMELPVVTSDSGGLPENVEDGVTGFVVRRRDPEAMADKLTLLACDPELRRRMGKAGRARVLERFDLRNQVAAFRHLYDDIAQIAVRTAHLDR